MRRPRFAASYLLVRLSLSLLVAGCSRAEPTAAAPAPSPATSPAPAPTPARDQTLMVFAASSLREAFQALVPVFEARHPEVKVTLNFAGSQELRAQIEQGAPADVFASADLRHMDALVQAKRVEAPERFAQNEPVLVVARENAASVTGLADLPKLERIVLGASEVPIGRYAEQILDRAGGTLGKDFRKKVEAKVVSRELNVRQVLAKVSLGEAQAAIVYRSDAKTVADKLETRAIPADLNVIADYPIAVVADTKQSALARDWVALVRGPEGRSALESAGLRAPDEPKP